jgi:PTS system cellobiose-specific IIA component
VRYIKINKHMSKKILTVDIKDDILLLRNKSAFKIKGGFTMEVIVADQIIMGLILNAGDAKQHIYQALSFAKEGNFDSADNEIEKANAALLEAHNLQTQFLAQEAGGTKTEITALFVHSQDHLMTSITEINLIKEMIDLRKELLVK